MQKVYVPLSIRAILNDYYEMIDSDAQVQLVEAKNEGDDILYEVLKEEMESGSIAFSNIQISANEVRTFLTNVYENNLFWDLGFQFTILKETQKEIIDIVSTTCYYPCSNFMKRWRSHFNLQDIMTRKEVNNCDSRGVFHTSRTS